MGNERQQALILLEDHAKLRTLLREHSHKKGTFTLASGKTSDFYIDVRRVALSAQGHWLLGRLLLDTVLSFNAEGVAGVELGGCPLASATSQESEARRDWPSIPALYVRKQAKDHGSSKLVETSFDLKPGARVVLVEDVITTGGSSERAVMALREAGYVVDNVVVVVDRLEGGREHLEGLGLGVSPLFTRQDFQD